MTTRYFRSYGPRASSLVFHPPGGSWSRERGGKSKNRAAANSSNAATKISFIFRSDVKMSFSRENRDVPLVLEKPLAYNPAEPAFKYGTGICFFFLSISFYLT